jgi:hypothetical protein
MANVFAVHSVGNSIVTFLRNTYPQQIAGRDMPAGYLALSAPRLVTITLSVMFVSPS